MADIFSLLNEINISLQGSRTNIFTLRNKMDAFKKKLALWNSRLQDEDVEMFGDGELNTVAGVKDISTHIARPFSFV